MTSIQGARPQPAAVNRPWLITTAASAGGTSAIRTIPESLPPVIVQNEATSEHRSMPRAAIRSGAVDYVLPLDAIGPTLNDIVHRRPVSVSSPQ
jgi:chemotaxis response regulator CheB